MAETQQELEDIKKLLVLLLMKIGADGGEIATALGVSNATVTRMVPKNKVKALKLGK